MTRRFLSSLAVLVGTALTGFSQSTPFVWASNARSGIIGDGDNWEGGIAPTSGADLRFHDWPVSTPELSLNAPLTVASLSFTSDGTSFVFSGDGPAVLSLGSGGVTIFYSQTTFASSLPITLIANQTWSTGADLLVDSVVTGGFGLTKTGSASLTFSGANTFTGGITVIDGSLTLASSSTANVNGSGVVTSVISGPVGTGTVSFAQNANLKVIDNITLHNAIDIASDVTVTAALGFDSLILSGVITGSGGIEKTGEGELTLNGLNSFTGGVSLRDVGTLRLGTSSIATVAAGVVTSVTSGPLGTGILDFHNGSSLGINGTNITLHNAIHLFTEDGGYIDSGAGNLTLAGVISGFGGFTKLGSGSLTLSGDNLFSRPLYINAGTLLISRSGVVMNDGGWSIVSSSVGTSVVTLAAGTTLAPTSGSGTITLYNAVILSGDASVGQVGSSDVLRIDTKPDMASGIRGSSSGLTLTVKGGVLILAASPTSGLLDTANLGTITVDGGAAVIFAFQSALPYSGVNVAAGGYAGVADGVLDGAPVGFQSSSSHTAGDLIGKLTRGSFAGTFGFDSETPASPGTFSGTLDFSAFGDANFAGLGTLSSAILSNESTLFAPTTGPNSGKLAFSGLNGGYLQIDTALLSAHNFTNGVIIGRDDGRGDRGTVALTNNFNTYTGGTTLKSGTLAVRAAGALGSGTITASNAITAPVTTADAPKLTTTLGTGAPLNLTLANNLVVDTSYASGLFGLGIGGTDDFTLSGTITGSGIIDKYSTGNLTLSGNATGFTGKINILGGTLTIGAGGTTGAISGNVTNNAALAFNRSDAVTYAGVITGSGSLTKLGTGSLTLTNTNSFVGGTVITSGTLNIGSGGTAGFIIGNITNNGTLSFNRSDAITFGGALSGTGSLVKQGTGTLTLTGSNSLTGGTLVSSGTLAISGSRLGTGDVTLSGGTLQTTGASSFTLNNNFFLSTNNGVIRNDLTGGAILTLNGNISLDGFVITFTGAGNTQATSINQAADLIVDGGNLTLTNASNSYDGPTFLRNAGTLTLGAVNALPTSPRTALILDDTGSGGSTFALGGFNNSVASLTGAASSLVNLGTGTLTIGTTSGTTTFGGIISGAGGNLIKDGASTEVLSGANTYTGTTTLSAGTLAIGAGGTAGSLAGNIVDNASLMFNRSDASTYAGVISGTGTVTKQGTGNLTLTGTNSYTGGTAITTGTLTLGGGGTTGSIAGNITDNGLLAFNRSDAVTFSGVISGTGAVTQQGSGLLTLGAVNTYTGGTVLNAGTLLVGADTALGNTSGGLTFGGGALKAATTLNSARAITLNAGGGIINTNTFTVTLSGLISGSGGLTHQGTGILVLGGTNAYTGGTTILGGGVVDITSNLNLGAAAGTVTLNGGYLRTQAAIGAFTHNLVLGASGGNLNTNGFDSTFSGQITGTGNLTIQSQTGNGKLTLTSAGNTYTGATNVDSGILEIAGNNGLPVATAVTLSNSAFLDLDANQTVGSLSSTSTSTTVDIKSGKTFTVGDGTGTEFAGLISGSGALVKQGSATLTLTNANTYSGGTTINAGILSVGNGGTTGSITGNVTDNGTLAFNRSNSLTFSGVISGSGDLLKLGTGTLILSSQNTYLGNTLVNTGTLRIGTANALPTSTQLVLGPGAILDVLSNQTIAGFFSAGSPTSTIQLGGGTIFTVAMPFANSATTFAGNVTGSGIFAVTGAGNDTVTLTGSVTNTGGAQVGAGATLIIGTGGSISGPISTSGTLSFGNGGSQTLGNVISGTGGVSATAGTTTLSAANLYSGPTNVTGGKLIVTNTTGSGTGTGTVTVGGGGIFGGTGTITGPLVLNSGGIVSPGSSPGTLSVGATTFAGGAHFAFEINNTVGTAGTNWDLLSISGLLNITATSGSPFIIDLTSLDSGNNPGLTQNFSSSGTYSWQFVTASGGITGFAANAFTFTGTNFQNNTGIGSFFVSQSGNNLSVNFIPVPEPSTYALLALGLGVVWLAGRRRK